MGGVTKVVDDFFETGNLPKISGGGGDIFSDFGDAFTQVTQPLEKAITAGVEDTSKNLTNALQPAEKNITQAVADTSKDLTSALQPVEKVVNYIGAHPDMQLALAMTVAIPVVGQYIGAELMAAGVVTSAEAASAAAIAQGATAAQAAAAAQAATATATVIGTAIASTSAQVAQGVPIEQAIQNTASDVAVQQLSPAAAKKLDGLLNNAAVTNAITSTVASGAATAAKGGSQKEIEKAMTAGLAGSAASSAYRSVAGTDSDIYSRTIGGATAGAVKGGTEGAVIGGLTTAAGTLGKPSKEIPPVAAPLDQTAAEDARLARQEASVAGSTKGSYLPETPFAMPDQTEAETARLARQEASIAGSTKGSYLPAGPVEEPKQGAYLPDAGPEGLVAPEDSSATEVVAEKTKTYYAPDLFISTYKTPKSMFGSSASTEALGKALGTATGSTTGLTAERGAGEIEGTGTGGQRKKVWNEESLKLKDALGV